MIKLGLDMATNSCGLCIMTPKKVRYGSFILSLRERKELSKSEKIERMTNWIFENIGKYFKQDHRLVVEDVFLGKNADAFKHVCRLQGALEHTYFRLTGKQIKYLMAVSARKNLDLRTRASKAEVQLFVIDKYNLGEVDNSIREYVNEQLQEYQNKNLSATTFKKRMNKVSTQIGKLTGINEHIADAIVLCLGAE